MGRSDGTRIGMGGTLVGVGGAGVVALLIYAAEITTDTQPGSPWEEWWFVAGFAVTLSLSALMAMAGFYIFGSVWFGWPLQATAIEQAFQPRLEGLTVEAQLVDGDDVVVMIGAVNAGRGNVEDAMLNILVPDFATAIERCTQEGEVGREEHKGATTFTPEALIPYQPTVGSNYWNGNVSFPGRMARLVFFRITKPGTPHNFPLRLMISAPELDDPFNEVFQVDVSKATRTQLPPRVKPASERVIDLLESIDVQLGQVGAPNLGSPG